MMSGKRKKQEDKLIRIGSFNNQNKGKKNLVDIIDAMNRFGIDILLVQDFGDGAVQSFEYNEAGLVVWGSEISRRNHNLATIAREDIAALIKIDVSQSQLFEIKTKPKLKIINMYAHNETEDINEWRSYFMNRDTSSHVIVGDLNSYPDFNLDRISTLNRNKEYGKEKMYNLIKSKDMFDSFRLLHNFKIKCTRWGEVKSRFGIETTGSRLDQIFVHKKLVN